ncbi:MAG: hypothetical protein K8F59_09725 [Rhodobacteraceae bacterium]|nr:hypothetical protein [Paracoccaceae bacterium]
MAGNGFAAGLRTLNDFRKWTKRKYDAPSPRAVRKACLARNSTQGATWVETGTFKGDTTAFLSGFSKKVYSIEPEPTLVENAVRRFANTPNVEIIKGTSEEILPDLLPKLSGDINFWLDGHYSAGTTFQGAVETPIADELATITKSLKNFALVSILVDDVRSFYSRQPENQGYPPLDFLVDWARDNGFFWTIEHDIFIARNY